MRSIAARIGVAALALSAAAHSGAAQSRWRVEATADAAFPTRSLAGASVRTGGGFGATFHYRVLRQLGAYGGWEWHMQRSAALLPGETVDLNDTGYSFGLRVEQRLAGTTAGWVRAGGLANHIEVENDAGDTIDDTGHGLGWELGAGLSVPLGERVSLTPGVRYRTLTRDIDVGGTTRSATLAYVTTGIGLTVGF